MGAQSPFIIGVDTGGTFTDCVIVDSDGYVVTDKSPSTPPDYDDGVLNSLRVTSEMLALDHAEVLARTASFVHGTTVATNAMVQRRGAKVGLLITKGFRDTLSIMRVMGRTAGLDTYQVQDMSTTNKPDPIVPKTLVREVVERVDYKGAEIVALDEAAAREAIQSLLDDEVEAIGVSLLWSFKNPAHEQRLKEIVHELAPDLSVSLSSEIIPKLGEYERTATTVVNAYVSPLLSRYLKKLDSRLQSSGLASPLLIMQSVGGVMAADAVDRLAVTTLMSGPAGGVTGAQYLGRLYGHDNVICTDVGGTSFDVGLVVDGSPVVTPISVADQYSLLLPTIDIESIGAGGGSIAHIGTGTILHVGPQSAGARPGPVAYGQGGTEPTVTDADVVLGFIDPEYFLGGRIALDPAAAAEAIRTKIAEPLGMSVDEAAAGIVEIINSHMADLVRKMTIRHGYDPRDFELYLYGGAGPTHGTAYGRDLEVRSMVVPLGNAAATFSALGIATADLLHVYELSDPMRPPFDLEKIEGIYQELETKGRDELTREGVEERRIRFERIVDMRYQRQVHEVGTPWPRSEKGDSLAELENDFHAVYEQKFGKGSGLREAGLEMVTFRVMAIGSRPKPDLARGSTQNGAGGDPVREVGSRPVFWREIGEKVDTKVFRGLTLKPGTEIAGPAIIELPATSIPLYPSQVAVGDEYGSFLIH